MLFWKGKPGLHAKVRILGMGSALFTAISLVALAVWQSGQFYQPDTAIVWATIIIAFVLGISVLLLSLAVIRRRRAEAALREKTEELDHYFMNSLDLLCIADTTGHFIRLNPEWENVFGFPLSELEGRVLLDLVHPDDQKATIKAVENLASQKKVLRFVNRYQCKDGTYRWIEWNSHPAGNLIYAVARDITERKRIEEALEKRIVALTQPLTNIADISFEDLFNLSDIQHLQDLFAEAFGVASLITHPDGAPITQPSHFSDLCGQIIRKTSKGVMNCMRSDAMMGRHNTKGPNIAPCFSAGLCNAGTSITVGGRHIANWLIGQVRNEQQKEEEIMKYAREIGADETAFREAYRKVPVMSQEQFEKVAHVLFAMANQLSTSAYQNVQQARFIAQRKQAEEALKKSEERFRSLVETSSDWVWETDRNGVYTYVSPKVTELLGYTSEEIIGKAPFDFMPPEEAKHIEAIFQDIVVSQQPFEQLENTALHKNKQLVVLETSGVPFFGANGELLGYRGIDRDITDRKRAEAELARHRSQLEELVKERTAELEKEIAERKQAEERIRAALAEKEVLLREVHHRVKNNLNTIANILYFQAKTVEDKRALAAFEESQSRIYSMAGIHEHLYRSANLTQINMAAYFEDLIGELKQTFGSGLVDIQIDVAKEHLDIDQAIPCGLVVNELVTNALKYAFQGHQTDRKKEITVRMAIEGDQRVLEVHDNGVGLPAGLDAQKSSSLGLRLVSMLTRQLKGRLAIDTQPGQGTKFTLTFPIETTGGSNGKN